MDKWCIYYVYIYIYRIIVCIYVLYVSPLVGVKPHRWNGPKSPEHAEHLWTWQEWQPEGWEISMVYLPFGSDLLAWWTFHRSSQLWIPRRKDTIVSIVFNKMWQVSSFFLMNPYISCINDKETKLCSKPKWGAKGQIAGPVRLLALEAGRSILLVLTRVPGASPGIGCSNGPSAGTVLWPTWWWTPSRSPRELGEFPKPAVLVLLAKVQGSHVTWIATCVGSEETFSPKKTWYLQGQTANFWG